VSHGRPIRLKSLEESGLGLREEDLSRLFAPFVARRAAAGDAEWARELARRKRKIRKRWRRRRLLPFLAGTRRSRRAVLGEYSRAWSKVAYAEYDVAGPRRRVAPWEWRGERLLATDVGATRVRQLLLTRVVEQRRPRRILEVGCGNGINLMLLAGRFPQVQMTGVDLTREGPLAAAGLQQHAELPKALQDFAPTPLEDATAFRRVGFSRADAGRLPFPDAAFDLVITVLALEQMERLRHQALAEIARVCGGAAFLVEPFRDVNDSGWPRRYVVGRNYFQGRIGELREHGLVPRLALADFPQETFLKACAVLAEKRGAP